MAVVLIGDADLHVLKQKEICECYVFFRMLIFNYDFDQNCGFVFAEMMEYNVYNVSCKCLANWSTFVTLWCVCVCECRQLFSTVWNSNEFEL